MVQNDVDVAVLRVGIDVEADDVVGVLEVEGLPVSLRVEHNPRRRRVVAMIERWCDWEVEGGSTGDYDECAQERERGGRALAQCPGVSRS